MLRIFFAALIISSLLEIEYPVNTSASGMFGVTIVHKGSSSFFKCLIELLLIYFVPLLAIITGSRTTFFDLYFFKIL